MWRARLNTGSGTAVTLNSFVVQIAVCIIVINASTFRGLLESDGMKKVHWDMLCSTAAALEEKRRK